MARRASIDIGTNSVLLLVAEVHGTSLTRVAERIEITRLGKGVDATHSLSPEAIARTLDALRHFRSVLDEHDVEVPRAVATSAVRDATNRDDFLVPAEAIVRAPIATLSGDEEARATFRGATLGLDLAPDARVVTFDIGGGSTEVIFGIAQRTPDLARSLDVGAVRFTERYMHHDPPTEVELLAVRTAAEQALASLGNAAPHDVLVGIAGTITTLAAVYENVDPYDATRIHGMRLTRTMLDVTLARLATLTLAARRNVQGLDARRADVIVAGAVIVQAIMDWSGNNDVVVSDGGVRVGLLLDEP
jgi:exopolyphosphatase/guanosine-5'-triphosphate,3'-diphosphate pyrophosphatase